MLSRLTATPRARFYLACAVGGALSSIVFAYLLLEGRANLFASEFLSSFYDVQARALLHGHWDVPARSLAWERFEVDGEFFTYFGPWPAFLRMPILAVTHRLDGQLARVSMLLAYFVLLTGTARLCWQGRTFVRGDGPPTRGTYLAAGGFVGLVGAGSTALFLAGRTWVYHEALLWGLAWSITAFACIVAYTVEPTRRRLVLASAATTLAFLSRATVGAGPVLALGAVLGFQIINKVLDARRARAAERDADDPPAPPSTEPAPLPRWQRVLGVPMAVARGRIWPVAVALAIPVTLYAYVNYSKFKTLFGLPLEKQDIIVASDLGQRAFAAGGGKITGLTYLPTNLLQYFRPDAIGFDRLFPWVTFSKQPRVIGDAFFIDIDFSASITASSTLVLLLAILGFVAIVRAPAPAGGGTNTAAVLRIPVLVASAGAVITLSIAYLQHRYEADFLPMFVVAGCVGVWYLARLIEGWAPLRRKLVLALVVVLGVWSCWATFSLTFLHQRAYGPLVPQSALARLVDLQLEVYGTIPGGEPSRIRHIDGFPLPEPDERQSLLVVGDCGGVFYSTGRAWHTVELTPETGRYSLRIRFGDIAPGTREPVVSATDKEGSSILWARRLRDGRFRLEYEWTGDPEQAVARTLPIEITPGEPFDLQLRLDPSIGFVSLLHDGSSLGLDYGVYGGVAGSPGVIGRQTAVPGEPERFSGTIDELPVATPVCDRIEDLEGS